MGTTFELSPDLGQDYSEVAFDGKNILRLQYKPLHLPDLRPEGPPSPRDTLIKNLDVCMKNFAHRLNYRQNLDQDVTTITAKNSKYKTHTEIGLYLSADGAKDDPAILLLKIYSDGLRIEHAYEPRQNATRLLKDFNYERFIQGLHQKEISKIANYISQIKTTPSVVEPQF